MSGRRRRDDSWDDGHQDAQDDRRDPWADGSVDEWGDRDPDRGDDARWSAVDVEAAWSNASGDGQGTGGYPARGGAGAYVSNEAAGKGYAPAPPAFPSFQAPGGSGRGSSAGGQASGYGSARNGERYSAGPGYGGQRERGTANGHGAAGYNGAGYQDSGYGRVDNGGSRREAAGYDGGPGGPRNGSAGGRNGYGANGRPAAPPAYAPEFTPADNADMDDDGPAGAARPYGRLSIYTLHEDKAREFDRLAERAAEGVRAAEPDTLVYVIHVVPKAPMQRIIYEIYRDRAAFLTHERQPHIRQFAAERAPCVLATNIIDLRLKYAKVAALGAPESPMPPQANRAPRIPDSAAGGDRYPAAGAQQPTAQHQATQYSAAQYPRTQSQQPGAASFTPAKERYADVGQPTVGREAYPPAAQYGSNGTGGYGAANGQYGAAGYANGGSYSSANSYQSPNGSSAGNGYGAAGAGGYSAANGHQGANGYADAGGNGYANGNGYSAANGYANGGTYQNGTGYANGSGYANGNGYSAASDYANGGTYQNGNGYGAAPGHPGNGATAQGPQYTPRYRELTSGASPDGGEGGYQDNGGYADGRQSYRPQSAEWTPRSQDQR
jgi:quinol monooxygenase YgiN